MKVLVLATNYPNNEGGISLFYIHTRNTYYVKSGVDVTVLNFAAKENYIIDGVKVITLKSYKKTKEKYDLLILHAPNLRNHYKFLKKHGNKFSKHLYFFHGHEVLMCSKVYSKPYDYLKKENNFVKNIYDYIKLKVWHNYFIKNNKKSYYIFVSNWMKEEFLKWVNIDPDMIKNNSQITYNSVGEDFIKYKYDEKVEKDYDFITVRGNLDGSKYSVDIINEMAYQNPNYKFLLVGKGKFFDYNKKANNIIWEDKHLSHKEIIEYLNKSKCALMPTKTDAQGLMACEMATFGIPLITSDIPVCHEVFDEFENVEYIDNEASDFQLIKKYEKIKNNANKISNKYYLDITAGKEIEIIKKIIKEK